LLIETIKALKIREVVWQCEGTKSLGLDGLKLRALNDL